MKIFEVCFEIYGKNLKTSVVAKTQEEAKEIIKSKINFHKITDKTPRTKSDFDFDNFSEIFKDLMK